MPSYQMPALNQLYSSNWSEQDVNRYHRLPYWTAVIQDQITKDTQVHSKLLGTKSWEPNKGTTLRTIIPQYTPLRRQFLRPKQLINYPRVDTVSPGQRESTDYIFEHQFTSDLLSWVPEFYDLMSSHERISKDLARLVALFPEMVARTYVFHQSRFAMFCGKDSNNTTPSLSILGRDIIMAPQGTGEESDNDTNPTTGKTLPWIKAQVLGMTGNAGLTLANVHRAITFMAQQQMQPFKGASQIAADNGIPSDKYLLVLGNEAQAQWIFDPLLRNLAGANADFSDGKHAASLMNRLITRTEPTPIRYYIDPVTKDVSIPEPEVSVLTGENAGEVVPNPKYLEAQIEVAFLYSGETFGNALKPGPPPSAFAKNGPSGNFAKLSWNGEIITYTPNMVQMPAVGGGLQFVENKDKRIMQMYANVAGGVQGIQKRAALPIFFFRNTGVNPVK